MKSSAGVLGCSSLRYIFPDSCKVFGLFYTPPLHLIHFFLSSPPLCSGFSPFFSKPQLSVASLWLPIIEHLIKTHFSKDKRLFVSCDRTQWKDYNLFVVSVIWAKRAWPIYWNFLDKRGCSNLSEQQALLRPVIRMLKSYDYVVVGDREFHSVELAKWLQAEGVAFAFRQKADTYIQLKGEDFQQLKSLDLSPGMKRFLTGVKVTKSKGFGKVALACYWKRTYKSRNLDEPWYILTNLGNLEETLAAYKARSGIEAMFKDCVRLVG
ncbi:IS4 family transposase [Planktothrix tepida]|uniref:IS4 family transposase n=1 Tax=Planktothrix tepida TaxID=1678309 RepID=UPI003F585DA0